LAFACVAPGSGVVVFSYEADLRFFKKRGKTFMVEVTTKISEIKTTNNNVIELPAQRAEAMINGEAKETGHQSGNPYSGDDTIE
jgi:hypothetical protein